MKLKTKIKIKIVERIPGYCFGEVFAILFHFIFHYLGDGMITGLWWKMFLVVLGIDVLYGIFKTFTRWADELDNNRYG